MSGRFAVRSGFGCVAALGVAFACLTPAASQAGRVRRNIECEEPAAGSTVSYAPLDLLVNIREQTNE